MDRRVGYPGLDFGYGGTLVLCAAVYGVLWSHRLTALWIVAVLGFCFGAVTWLVDIAFMVGVLMEESGVGDAVRAQFSDPVWLPCVLTASTLGTIVSVTVWLIIRPDRAEIMQSKTLTA